jgi:UDP-3-O-acyl-N-acetylglucosamine deacetylase
MDCPPPIGRQEVRFVIDSIEIFKEEIAPARTYGFVKDYEKLEAMGLAKGGRLNNLILVDDERVINTSLRFPDEFARHKVLDTLGDLYLLGKPIKGEIHASMTGHTENITLLRKIAECEKN